jgi:hypothetical protein
VEGNGICDASCLGEAGEVVDVMVSCTCCALVRVLFFRAGYNDVQAHVLVAVLAGAAGGMRKG